MLHLIISYPFSRQVWHEILAWMRMTCTTQPTDPRDISLRLVDESQASHPKSHAQRASLHNLSRTMDDMEAPKRLRIRQSTAFHLNLSLKDQGRGRSMDPGMSKRAKRCCTIDTECTLKPH